ncbi:MAG: class C sortase [Erysipelotrichaceae bacterium]|nr:class C sortase [Erysipelotrichaceae bacterium]
MFKKKEKSEKTTAPENWFKKNWSTILIAGIFITGLCIFIYPSFADYWNSFHQTRAIMSYSDAVSKLSKEDYTKEIEKALEYNRDMAPNGMRWEMTDPEKEEYNDTLNFTGNGIMGYITIDKIKVTLPIYHGTNESVLQTSIGHLESSSLPVGAYAYDYEEGRVTDSEDGSHCILTGHRGLPSAKLFSDLDKLNEGDIFTLNILGETYTYQVDQIRVVEPSDLSELMIVPGMDYCTLVTCTPYGINTHRLLVRGHRTANPQGDVMIIADAILIDSVYVAPFIAAPIILVLVLAVLFESKKRGKERKDESKTFL